MEKIKILFLQMKLVCGGAEQALYDLISLMDKSKFDISVLAYIGGGEWEDKFRNAGISVENIFVPREHGCGPMAFLKHQIRKMRNNYYLKRNPQKIIAERFPQGVDILISYSSLWEYNEIGFSEGAKSILFVHGDPGTNSIYRDILLQNRDLIAKFHRIVCVSDQAYESFCREIGFSERTEMHFNPLNSDNVKLLAEQVVCVPEDRSVICAVGRLAPEKGYDRLIRIHKRILEQGIPHRLMIVGDGPEREHLQQVIRETRTEDTVLMMGYQSNPYPYMKKSRFLVCSSYTEGLPVIVMEALALGIPVVSALPSIGEVFGDTACGLITDNDDDSLQMGIYQMLTDTVLYDRTKKAAERRSEYLDGKRMVKEMEDLFLEVMGE